VSIPKTQHECIVSEVTTGVYSPQPRVIDFTKRIKKIIVSKTTASNKQPLKKNNPPNTSVALDCDDAMLAA